MLFKNLEKAGAAKFPPENSFNTSSNIINTEYLGSGYGNAPIKETVLRFK